MWVWSLGYFFEDGCISSNRAAVVWKRCENIRILRLVGSEVNSMGSKRAIGDFFLSFSSCVRGLHGVGLRGIFSRTVVLRLDAHVFSPVFVPVDVEIVIMQISYNY